MRGQKAPCFVVLDIEGTVTSIDFATKTLFPYARMHTAAFLSNVFDDEAAHSIFHELRLQGEKVRHRLCVPIVDMRDVSVCGALGNLMPC